VTAVDTSRTQVFRQSPWQMVLLALGAAAFVAASLLILTGVIAMEGEDNTVIGLAGAGFFGLCFVLIVWRLISMRGPVVTLDPEGIRDTRIAAKVIPWSAVEQIGTWEAYRQKIIVISVPAAVEQTLELTRIARWSRGANRSLGADGLCITTQGLPVSHDQLMKLVVAYANAHR
jgi:hypothetical protein